MHLNFGFLIFIFYYNGVSEGTFENFNNTICIIYTCCGVAFDLNLDQLKI